MSLLALAGAAFLALALGLYIWSRRMHTATGLPRGQVIYSDAGAWKRNEVSFFSQRYRLTGKPDYLIRADKSVIPVELKSGSTPDTPHKGHILQLAAYCLLIEENLATRPTYGIIQYPRRQFTVPYTEDLKRELLEVMAQMRVGAGDAQGPHRSHTAPRRCAVCGVREECDERLDQVH